MIPGYALQQLRAASSILTRGQNFLQRRLESAYEELELLIAADFPAGLGKDYTDIVSRLTRLGSVAETVAAMSDNEAAHIASLISALHFATEAAPSGEAPSAGEDTIEADPALTVR
jgi:hypothetical protein